MPASQVDLTMRCPFIHWTLRHAGAVALLLLAIAAQAQELEPRSYSPSPIGTNFLVASYVYLYGNVLTDPSLPITGVEAKISTVSLAYSRTFALAGHTASLALAMPFSSGNLSGVVIGAPTEVHRAGIGDLKLRFAWNFIGSPALTPEEFARREQATLAGISLTMSAPTGQYLPSRLVNIGANRWGFKPEIGISQPYGNWFFDASAGAWFFTRNNDFFHGNKRGQDPLMLLQLHAGYSFRQGLWVAADIGYAAGGRSSMNGVPNEDRRANMRYGLTFSAPVARGWSAKLAFSSGFVTRAGGDYKSVTLALQYRWFDR
ncbi:transporter [Paraburkholderia graminis]|nr:transporter [Paraburkholderia graminis]